MNDIVEEFRGKTRKFLLDLIELLRVDLAKAIADRADTRNLLTICQGRLKERNEQSAEQWERLTGERDAAEAAAATAIAKRNETGNDIHDLVAERNAALAEVNRLNARGLRVTIRDWFHPFTVTTSE